MTKRQCNLLLVAAALLMHLLLFDWNLYTANDENPYRHEFLPSRAQVLWYFNLESLGLGLDALAVCYDWSYVVFQGINLVFAIFGLLVPTLLLIYASIHLWNDHKIRRRQADT